MGKITKLQSENDRLTKTLEAAEERLANEIAAAEGLVRYYGRQWELAYCILLLIPGRDDRSLEAYVIDWISQHVKRDKKRARKRGEAEPRQTQRSKEIYG